MLKMSTRLLVLFFVLTLLVAGCAKKPVVGEAEVDETATPDVTVVAEQPVSSVDEQPVTEDTGSNGSGSYTGFGTNDGLFGAGAEELQRIHFDFDQYVLTDAAKRKLSQNAKLIKASPGVKVKIEGHCDERGSDEYNLALGEKRALATKSYLVSLGVSASGLSVISYGEEMPLDPSMTEDAWAKNRRAEFKVKR